MKFILSGKITNSMSNKTSKEYISVLEITDEFNKKNGTGLKQVFAINIFPVFSFVYNKEKNTIKIATYYIIGYDQRTNKINIFFDQTKRFEVMHNGCRGLSRQINEYNADNNFKIKDLINICENLAPIAPTGYFANNNYIYRTSLDKINGQCKTELIKVVQSNDPVDICNEMNKLR